LKTTKSKVNFTDFKMFKNLSDESLTVIRRGLRYASYKKSGAVLQKGQAVSGAYFVMSGELRVYTISAAGKEATLYLIRPGETCVLALNCVFNNFLYPAWVKASASCRIAIIPGSEYRFLFDNEPSIRDLTIRSFSTILFRLMAELEVVHSTNLETRLVRLLLLNCNTDNNVNITQQEIASHLGTSREVIARLLRKLAMAGYIKTGHKCIGLIKSEALKNLGHTEKQ